MVPEERTRARERNWALSTATETLLRASEALRRARYCRRDGTDGRIARYVTFIVAGHARRAELRASNRLTRHPAHGHIAGVARRTGDRACNDLSTSVYRAIRATVLRLRPHPGLSRLRQRAVRQMGALGQDLGADFRFHAGRNVRTHRGAGRMAGRDASCAACRVLRACCGACRLARCEAGRGACCAGMLERNSSRHRSHACTGARRL